MRDDDRCDQDGLLKSMHRHETVRTASLKRDGQNQMNYPKSNAGWIATFFVVRGRALDSMFLPWVLVVVHATTYTIVHEIVYGYDTRDMEPWEIFFSFVLNSTLSFLLVFRLNRAASRFWSARQYWGDIVARSRSVVGGVIAHGSHNQTRRDEVIRWVGIFAITAMEYLRGTDTPSPGIFAGILDGDDFVRVQKQVHPPLYAIDQVRHHLKRLFLVEADTAPSLATGWSIQLDNLESQVNSLIWSAGGMERIKATPLPIVYVSHLRTFILINLILFPWVFGPSWSWSTIPIVAASAFAWLGIDSAAVEVESPFKKERVNALDMNGFVIGLLSTIQQQLENSSDCEC